MFTYNANVIIDQQKGVKIPLVCARLVIDCRLVMQMKLPAERRQMRMKKSPLTKVGTSRGVFYVPFRFLFPNITLFLSTELLLIHSTILE